MTANIRDAPEGQRKILVAVDFGTTYSGLAWAQTSQPDRQSPIQQWPSATSTGFEGFTDDKVPTTIKYDGSTYKWGSQIGKTELRHEWFKLDLDPAQLRGVSSLAMRYPNPSQLARHNVSAEKLTIDYLTALRTHAENIMTQNLTRGIMRTTPREYIITVPAVWSERAQTLTRSCAEQAGMGNAESIQIISEPEAAAIYALGSMDRSDVDVGDTFVVCDAGGGTVDLISYTVLGKDPCLRLQEAAPGSGQLCGSTFLNRIFAQFMQEKFRNNLDFDEEALADATFDFEHGLKRSFHGQGDENYSIAVPGVSGNGIRRGRLRLTRAEVVGIFDPVVSEVITLVRNQIRATRRTVKLVLLVGGFGTNPYLRERIRDAVGDAVEVKVAIHGWTAVVRGALMKGITEVTPNLPNIRVEARTARKYIGTEAFAPYDPEKHKGMRKHPNTVTGGHKVSVMQWFIKKGDQMRESRPVPFHFSWDFPVSAGLSSITMDLLCFEDLQNSGQPPQERDNTVKKLGQISADLSRIPSNRLDPAQFGQDGRLYYCVDYDIQMTPYSASATFTLVYKQVPYGSATMEYA